MRQFQICGNLGQDVELKHVGEKQTAVAQFSVAVADERDKDRTHWYSVKLWGKQAEVAQRFLAKGRKVVVWGRIDLEQWQDKQGNNRQAHAFTGEGFTLCDKPPATQDRMPREDSAGYAGPAQEGGFEEDIPF